MSPTAPDVGPTPELSLRVSAASLARVLFPHPEDGSTMLALEHKATVLRRGSEPRVKVQAQPFGGAVRLLEPASLAVRLGRFNYDSERSQTERDFRVFIHPASWPELLGFCRRLSEEDGNAAIEAEPTRELEEEFADALGTQLQPRQYEVERAGLVVERRPAPTGNVRAPGQLTARIYWVYEVRLCDPALCASMMGLSERKTARDLRSEALADAREGGPGRANGVLLASLAEIRGAYGALPPAARGEPLPFSGAVLAGNVAAVLGDLPVPKYEFFAASSELAG